METEIVKRLNWYYYGIILLAVLTVVGGRNLIVKDIVSPINPMTTLGQVLQYIVIFDALICEPLGLWLHNKKCQALKGDPTKGRSEEQLKGYEQSARQRILLVSHPMIPALAAFYLLGGYQSMIWVAAIAAIGWYFTKPTEGKINQELI